MSNKRFKNQQGYWQVYTEIEINAPVEKVWQVMTDFDQYHEWSPTLKGLRGELKDGAKVDCEYLWGKKVNKLKHTLIVEDGVLFGWSDPILPLAKDRHIYKVEALENGKGTLMTQTDQVTGLFGRVLGDTITKQMLITYEAFNQALKARVEGG